MTSEIERINLEKNKIEEELVNNKEAVKSKVEEIKNIKSNYQMVCDKLELEKKSVNSDNSSLGLFSFNL